MIFVIEIFCNFLNIYSYLRMIATLDSFNFFFVHELIIG